MSLSEISIETKKVTAGDQEFFVRGLSFTDLMGLFQEHSTQMQELFLLAGNLSDQDNMDALIQRSLEVAPDVINLGVALAADEPDMYGIVKKLPIPIVADAIEKIMSLTFKNQEQLVNFISSLAAGMEKATDSVNSQLQSSSPPSEKESLSA